MPTEGFEPPWPDYKTGTLPIKWNRLGYYYMIHSIYYHWTIFILYNIQLF